MLKLVAVLLSAVTLTIGAPVVLANAVTSSLRGQVVDASGRGTPDLLVELVSERALIATTISTTDGHFGFSGLPAGNYVVRTSMNGQPSGVRTSVTGGATATALLVLPSLSTAGQAAVLAAIAPAWGSLVSATVTTVANVVIVQAVKGQDEETLIANVSAANQVIQGLNEQNQQSNPGAPTDPVFSFIPTTPESGSQ